MFLDLSVHGIGAIRPSDRDQSPSARPAVGEFETPVMQERVAGYAQEMDGSRVVSRQVPDVVGPIGTGHPSLEAMVHFPTYGRAPGDLAEALGTHPHEALHREREGRVDSGDPCELDGAGPQGLPIVRRRQALAGRAVIEERLPNETTDQLCKGDLPLGQVRAFPLEHLEPLAPSSAQEA